MKTRLTKTSRKTLVLVGTLILSGSLIAWQWDTLERIYFNRRVAAVTAGLPRCDRIEVLRLGGLQRLQGPEKAVLAIDQRFPIKPYSDFAEIRGAKTVSGDDAESIAQLWRSQTFGREFQALCHHPTFGIRFFSGNDLMLETSVCFGCSNFTVDYLATSQFHGFDTDNTKARELYERLQQLFPKSEDKVLK